MPSSNLGSPAVDGARQALCRELAGCMNAGTYTIRVRIVKPENAAAEGHFYAHSGKGWRKRPEKLVDHPVVAALEETLDMLGSKPHCDEWSVRCESHADRRDTELQFHPDKIKPHLGPKLESALYGLLFRDHHDSKKDVRRSIRTPRPAQNRGPAPAARKGGAKNAGRPAAKTARTSGWRRGSR